MKEIGGGAPCFIIAEAGVNHNGSIETAKKLVDAAKEAEADAVKFQTFHAEKITTHNSKKAPYQNRAKEKSQYQMLKNLELDDNEFRELKAYCDKKDIEFMSTPYDLESVKLLTSMGVTRFKVASADLVNKQLIKEIAGTYEQVILSTGMAILGEIERTVALMRKIGNNNLVLLHCTSNYPTFPSQVNMKAMNLLKTAFGYPVGYSDHTTGVDIPLMAVSLGAEVIEKHITLNRNAEGPDHSTSLEPDMFTRLVYGIRDIEQAFGNGQKEVIHEEKMNSLFMRRSIHASKDIEQGERISRDNVKVTRPYNGIDPWSIDEIQGRVVKRDMRKDQPIQLEHLQ